MSVKLNIFNPSNYPRGGIVTTPWEPIYKKTGIPPDQFGLNQSGRELSIQIDEVVPGDPSRVTLIFNLLVDVEPGPENYAYPSGEVGINSGAKRQPQIQDVQIDLIRERNVIRAVKMSNSHISIYISLWSSTDWKGERKWYAGSATSVLIDKLEFLDAFKSLSTIFGHDSEKRCIQIDRIKILNSPWEDNICQLITLFDRNYQLVTYCEGPLRASITVACEPFAYDYFDITTHQKQILQCQLYRVISLYAGANFVMEEIFLRGHTDHNDMELSFIPHYFTHMDMGFNPEIYKYEDIPDWFAVGYPYLYPFQGYGFATNMQVRSLQYPHDDPPNLEYAYKRFSWELCPCRSAKCLHLFMGKQSPPSFGHEIGNHWYTYLFRPLSVEICD